MKFKRYKPHPIPTVHPIWEYKATGELYETYEAYKKRLQIPWVGVVTMAYAHYAETFKVWWEALAPIVATQDYVDQAMALREKVETAIESLDPPPIRNRLLEIGYTTRELDEIIDMMDVITHGNFMQVAAVFLLPMALEGIEPGSFKKMSPKAAAHGPKVQTPFVLVEPHHALQDVQEIYSDIKETLGLPFVNTDYRCFARWPSYFTRAWTDLRPALETTSYDSLVNDMHNAIVETAVSMPNPTGVRAKDLITAANKDASLEEVLNTTRLFAWLLPGLVTNVAFFRAQLLK